MTCTSALPKPVVYPISTVTLSRQNPAKRLLLPTNNTNQIMAHNPKAIRVHAQSVEMSTLALLTPSATPSIILSSNTTDYDNNMSITSHNLAYIISDHKTIDHTHNHPTAHEPPVYWYNNTKQTIGTIGSTLNANIYTINPSLQPNN